MRRMIPDPGKVIKCSFENEGRNSNIYVPIKNLDELPIKFDLILSNSVAIASVYAYYSEINGEVYGGGSFSQFGDGKGIIDIIVDPDSLIKTEFPYLKLVLNYIRGDIQSAPINVDALVFATNIVHLEKGVIDIA